MKADQMAWAQAQRDVSHWLYSHGIRVEFASFFAPFDLYSPNGTRIEVKYAPFTRTSKKWNHWGWRFNIHRRGKVDCSKVDFYILRCDTTPKLKELGFDTPIHLVIPSPIETPTFNISLRTMLTKWGAFANSYEPIQEFDITLDEARRIETYLLAAAQVPNKGRGKPKLIKPPRLRPLTDRALAVYSEGMTASQLWEQLKAAGLFDHYTSAMASRVTAYRLLRGIKDGTIKSRVQS